MKKISYVIPCYRSENTISHVVNGIDDVMQQYKERYSYEVILVNDCSPDHTYDTICNIAENNEHVKGVNLAKNFGQQGALMAGFSCVSGDLILCMDDDGQTAPSEIPKLIGKYEEGYDVVYARYAKKKHSAFRNFGSRVNDWMATAMLGKPKNLYASSFFIMERYVIDEIVKCQNPYPYILGLILRTTGNITNVDVIHQERIEGRSGYTLAKLLGLWMNGFTAFSVLPLRIATVMGLVMSFLAMVFMIIIIIHKFMSPDVPVGWSSLVTVLLFVSGIMMCMMGLLGEYIGRLYVTQNRSPQYVIRDRTEKQK